MSVQIDRGKHIDGEVGRDSGGITLLAMSPRHANTGEPDVTSHILVCILSLQIYDCMFDKDSFVPYFVGPHLDPNNLLSLR